MPHAENPLSNSLAPMEILPRQRGRKRIKRTTVVWRIRTRPADPRLVDRMAVELHTYPRPVRIAVMLGSAGALWVGILAASHAALMAV